VSLHWLPAHAGIEPNELINDEYITQVAMDNNKLPIKSIKTVEITFNFTYGRRILRIKNVYYSPQVGINVLSLSAFFD
jgi:hypothetical protein